MSDTVALALVRAYQVGVAPLTGGACRFTPSCSAYAIEAVEMHGAARGLWLALRRVARCHPWGGFGYDPVPHPHGPAASLRRSLQSGLSPAQPSGRAAPTMSAQARADAGGSSRTLES